VCDLRAPYSGGCGCFTHSLPLSAFKQGSVFNPPPPQASGYSQQQTAQRWAWVWGGGGRVGGWVCVCVAGEPTCVCRSLTCAENSFIIAALDCPGALKDLQTQRSVLETIQCNGQTLHRQLWARSSLEGEKNPLRFAARPYPRPCASDRELQCRRGPSPQPAPCC
jgi:hypothetical protein